MEETSNKTEPQIESGTSRKIPRDEVRFWQGIALSLAIFALGLVASCILMLIGLLLAG
jgi:hypothetical protein